MIIWRLVFTSSRRVPELQCKILGSITDYIARLAETHKITVQNRSWFAKGLRQEKQGLKE